MKSGELFEAACARLGRDARPLRPQPRIAFRSRTTSSTAPATRSRPAKSPARTCARDADAAAAARRAGGRNRSCRARGRAGRGHADPGRGHGRARALARRWLDYAGRRGQASTAASTRRSSRPSPTLSSTGGAELDRAGTHQLRQHGPIPSAERRGGRAPGRPDRIERMLPTRLDLVDSSIEYARHASSLRFLQHVSPEAPSTRSSSSPRTPFRRSARSRSRPERDLCRPGEGDLQTRRRALEEEANAKLLIGDAALPPLVRSTTPTTTWASSGPTRPGRRWCPPIGGPGPHRWRHGARARARLLRAARARGAPMLADEASERGYPAGYLARSSRSCLLVRARASAPASETLPRDGP